jgi:ubiquinone/menaquinone biosynthesis C-methylase UbiE
MLVPFNGSSRDVAMCKFRLCQHKDQFLLVAIVVPPLNLGADFLNVHFYCKANESRAGGIATKEFVYWDIFRPLLTTDALLVTASLSELIEYEIVKVPDGENIAMASDDQVITLEFGFSENLPAHMNIVVPSRITLPFPSGEHILRVAGPIGLNGFLTSGASWFFNLKELVRRYVGRELAELDAVLDWGCGCGRILRHALESGITNIRGVDIDDLNIRWLCEKFPQGSYVRTNFDPPLPYPGETFDVVFGHSVFTHLARDDQDLWLAEISRVLKGGGYAFVTVATELGTYLAHQSELEHNSSACLQFVEEGIAVLGEQSVGVDVGRDSYYKLTCHSTSFVMKEWNKYFEVCRVVRSFAEHQDLVVLRRSVA